jgi:N-acetylmuramoyl-L-alanine amidase
VAVLVYVGIAVVQETAVPAYAGPAAEGEPVGEVPAGGHAPHFRATEDHAWLEVTLRDGEVGWIRNDPDLLQVVLPDPTRIRVCLDPGHGGGDPGARRHGLVEKELTLDIVFNRLYPRLIADDRIERVWITRDGDYDVSLKYRWDLANAAMPALFLSIHLNSSEDETVRGTETYYKCGAEATEWQVAGSRRAACLLHRRLREAVADQGAPGCPWTDRGVICRLVGEENPRSFYLVLQNTNFRAVLPELLYLSNPGEAACLAQESFQDRLAQALADAVSDILFTDLPGDDCDFRQVFGI